jgi:thymidylate synthase
MIVNKEVANILAFKYEDFVLADYNPHPAIKGEISV